MKDRSKIHRKRIFDVLERYDGDEISLYGGAVKAAFGEEEWHELIAKKPDLTIVLI